MAFSLAFDLSIQYIQKVGSLFKVTFKAELGFKARLEFQIHSGYFKYHSVSDFLRSIQHVLGLLWSLALFIRPTHMGPARGPCVQEQTGPVSFKDQPWDQLNFLLPAAWRWEDQGQTGQSHLCGCFSGRWCRKGDAKVVIYGEICGTPTRSCNS